MDDKCINHFGEKSCCWQHAHNVLKKSQVSQEVRKVFGEVRRSAAAEDRSRQRPIVGAPRALTGARSATILGAVMICYLFLLLAINRFTIESNGNRLVAS